MSEEQLRAELSDTRVMVQALRGALEVMVGNCFLCDGKGWIGWRKDQECPRCQAARALLEAQ